MGHLTRRLHLTAEKPRRQVKRIRERDMNGRRLPSTQLTVACSDNASGSDRGTNGVTLKKEPPGPTWGKRP
jgi:hypothetical protein